MSKPIKINIQSTEKVSQLAVAEIAGDFMEWIEETSRSFHIELPERYNEMDWKEIGAAWANLRASGER
jgi:hypothetical protein